MPSLYVSNKEFAIVEIRMGLNLTFFFLNCGGEKLSISCMKKISCNTIY